MAITSSGQIKISEIATELGVGGEPNLNLRGLESGTFATINTNSATTPNGIAPHAMSEWYSYDHSATAAYSNTRYYQNDGTGDYINCVADTSPFSINTTQDLSFSVWVRHTGSKQNQLVFNFGNTNANGNNRIFMTYSASLNRMILRVRTNSVNFDRQFPLHDNSSATGISNSTSGWSSTSRGSVNSDNFCMLTMTYDASQTNAANAFKFYWNASECTTQSNANSGTRTGITSIRGRIGENLNATDSAGNATLDFDEFKIYNKVLTSSEVSTLYNSGTIADSSETVSSGLITEWTFDNNNANDSNSKYTNTIVNGTITAY
jgi:hypothetical protein